MRLALAWTEGRDRCAHKGFGVYLVRSSAPKDFIGKYQTAELAVAAATRLSEDGNEYGAFRVYTRNKKEYAHPKERILPKDLPVEIVNA
jgi:hypothetical protein